MMDCCSDHRLPHSRAYKFLVPKIQNATQAATSEAISVVRSSRKHDCVWGRHAFWPPSLREVRVRHTPGAQQPRRRRQ